MELRDKYYVSLKEAVHYLDNVKRNYNEQKCSYNIIIMHINKIKNSEEKLGDYLNNMDNIIEKQKAYLGRCLLADIIIFLIIGGFIVELLSVGIPITLVCCFVSSLFYFAIAHRKI